MKTEDDDKIKTEEQGDAQAKHHASPVKFQMPATMPFMPPH